MGDHRRQLSSTAITCPWATEKRYLRRREEYQAAWR
jgi:hypothetical protein